MSEFAAIVPCICGAISIIEDLIDIKAKMRVGDQSAIEDLLRLVKNYENYTRNEKKMIRKTLHDFLEMIATPNNSGIIKSGLVIQIDDEKK